MEDAVSFHYAKALAEAVFRPDSGLTPAEAITQLNDAATAIRESRPLRGVLLSPAISRARKTAVVARLAGAMKLHKLLRNFLLVVSSHRRVNEMDQILSSFEAVVDDRTGFVPAEIISAGELSAAQRERIERALGTKLGKYIRAHYRVDPGLLGGVLARVASREYDATLRGKLDSMRYRLAAR
ncbi:MAG TPA: ATP synthase F1 subunit delta [Bryobacteraceae bacterium]|jgi:F-type H+-transporting ATPase subunit delta|nr:ATP synthase F1 subunit delta [Bryobacteraceae bacterium]